MNSGAGRAGTGQGNGPPPPRIKYQRHSAEDRLQRNLARWQARGGRRAAEPAGQRLRRVLAMLAAVSLVVTGGMMVSGLVAQERTRAEVTGLVEELAALRALPGVQPFPWADRTALSPEARESAAQEQVRQLQHAARNAAGAAADAQNALALAEAARAGDDEGFTDDPDAPLRAINEQRIILSDLFAPATKSWRDERVLGWASAGMTAQDQGDPRLQWTLAQPGCSWATAAVTATSLTGHPTGQSSNTADRSMAVLWECRDTGADAVLDPAGSPARRAWATAAFSDGVFTSFAVAQVRELG